MKRKKLIKATMLGLGIVGVALSAMTYAETSDFIHENMVDGTGTITVCDPNSNGTKCITMMDKNLGASKSGTICSLEDSGACGNHYQWGNNYGFKIGCFTYGCSDDVTSGSTNTLATWLSDFNHIGYIGTTFIKGTTNSKGDYWDDNTPMNHSGLRGGEKDSEGNNRGYDLEHNVAFDVQNRRGPCPEGYHVPSAGEWGILLKYWVENYTGSTHDTIALKGTYPLQGFTNTTGVTQFQVDFKIPIAGDRFYESAQVFYIGTWGHYWSSSSIIDKDTVRMFRLVYHSIDFTTNRRAAGQSVRCFKNTPLIFPNYVSLIDNTDFIVTAGNQTYTGLDDIMEVTTNNEVEIEADKPVVGEVSVAFGEDVSAKFNKLVKVNVPVDDYDKVIIKVKHVGSNEYNFDGLTTNASASCDANGKPTSNQYNGTPITVVDGFASIYTCEASSFIALGIPPVEAQINLSVIKGTLTIGTTTGNLNLGQVNVSNTAQELSGSFGANSFWVEDMKGVESGYYTTISVTDLTGSVAGHVISADNLSLKTAGNEPSYISGAIVSEAKVIFGNGITDWHSGSGQVNYFQRLNTDIEYAGRVGKWGDNLQVKVSIPAHTPYDTYKGTITYTLYDMDL